MRETQTTKMNIIPFLLFYIENLYFVRVFFFRVEDHWKYSNKTPTPIYICIGVIDFIRRPKILCNRLGTLT